MRENISSYFNTLSDLKRGSVWALNLLHVMTLIALFCNLINLDNLNPQLKIPYWRCGSINELYKTRRILVDKYRLRRFMTPRVREILLELFCICAFQFKCWSIWRPKKLKSVTLSIGESFILMSGINSSILRWRWWKIIYLVLNTFKDS